MVKVSVFVLASEDRNDSYEMGTYELAGVPRVGETLLAKGSTFTVKFVDWFDIDEMVSITVENDVYGYHFPVMDGLTTTRTSEDVGSTE